MSPGSLGVVGCTGRTFPGSLGVDSCAPILLAEYGGYSYLLRALGGVGERDGKNREERTQLSND